MHRKTIVRMLALVLAILGMAAAAGAQVTTGSVAGSVKDAQGGVIPGATVGLMSEARGTKLPEVVTNGSGDFVFVNLPPDTYQVTVNMTGFKTLTRGGIAVSPGDRVSLNPFTIALGGATETVNVTAEVPLIQSRSGERSFTIDTKSVENLPILSRSFTALALLAPGVNLDGNGTPTRIGGGGDANIMMDGVSAMDTGSNRPLLMMNTESIAEVKVLTSGYQAEYGRASGVQISAVTKSGTNRFHGSIYGVFRDSKWYANSKTNILNGNLKTILKEKDLGYTIGGPIGKPGGANKLFFFYSQEFAPRTRGNNVQNFRMPTALERAGDFSQTTDNNGALYNAIKDPNLTGNCTLTDTTACFKDGGVLGRIPANRLYATGLAILNRYPLPNLTPAESAGLNYNYVSTRGKESVVSWQPAVRVDFQPLTSLRMSFKYSGWQQANHTFIGTIPGFNDTRMQKAPVTSFAFNGNYTVNSTTFIEATYGRSQNQLAGCAQAQSGTGAIFCDAAVPVAQAASLSASGLGSLPFLYPDATVLTPGYYAIKALDELKPAFWDGTRMAKVPTINFGGRVANSPPQTGFPGWLNINTTNDFSVSLTKVADRHTLKTGYYLTHSYKAEQTSNNAFGTINFQEQAAGTNPFDTSYAFANAAIGTFNSYQQAQKYAETSAIYQNIEFYAQDNWKVNRRLTLDYGLRFVFQQAQYDNLGQASNFLPDKWTLAGAPQLYRPGCVNNANPCSGGNRRAFNPVTGQLAASSTTLTLLNATLVDGSGNPTNGLFLPDSVSKQTNGVSDATYNVPTIVYAPRFGMAFDLKGDQSIVLRGGVGMFYDRPSSTTFSGGVNNPPTSGTVTQNNGQLQAIGSGGLITRGVPGLNGFAFNGEVPSSVQWNTGVQMTLPFSSSLDVAYSGQHSYNFYNGVNINAIDFGTFYLAQSQDPTLAASATPGATALPTNLLRPMRGYGGITMQLNRAVRTFHSLQLSFQRRFSRGLAFGFVDTWQIYDHQQSGARLQHDASGQYWYRADQAKADELLGDNNPAAHTMRANFVWDLPDLHSPSTLWRAIGLVANDWQLSGIWQGVSGSPYSVGLNNFQNGSNTNTNMTGSPDYSARVVIVDPNNLGGGCSKDPYRQFNIAAFGTPAPSTATVYSDGLESSSNYLKGCFQSAFDLSIQRNIRLGGGRTAQIRVDIYNAPNQAIITGRQTGITFNAPGDATITNSPFDATGAVAANRIRPNQAGVGAANGYQTPRQIQASVRFSF